MTEGREKDDVKNGKAEAVEDVHQIVLLSIDLKLDGYEESKIETIDNCTSHCNLSVEMHVYRERENERGGWKKSTSCK